MTALAEARGLALDYVAGDRRARALDGADLRVAAGERLAVIGESGSGKTTLGMAMGRILPGAAVRAGGELTVAGVEVFEAPPETLRRLRREVLGFVFQNPMSALDPTLRIGRQLALAAARPLSSAERGAMLARAGLDAPERVAAAFPHELSGGMAQRVVIAMAVARGPRLLIADEPTASLDVSVRDRVMETLAGLSAETGAALMILSHDLRTAARRAEAVAVMYAGRVVERGPVGAVLARPAHPYTRALLASAAGSEGPGGRLAPIPGAPPMLRAAAVGCAFAPRCAFAAEVCAAVRPETRTVDGRAVLCHRAEAVLAAAPGAAA